MLLLSSLYVAMRAAVGSTVQISITQPEFSTLPYCNCLTVRLPTAAVLQTPNCVLLFAAPCLRSTLSRRGAVQVVAAAAVEEPAAKKAVPRPVKRAIQAEQRRKANKSIKSATYTTIKKVSS